MKYPVEKMFLWFIIGFLFISCENITKSTEKSDRKKVEKIERAIKKDTFNFLPTSTTGEIVHHKYYTLSYNEDYENAEWVAYSLSPKQLSRAQRKRPYFIRDPDVRTESPSYKNYYPNGYEKGHLVPAADMRFSEQAFNQTFYTSNVSPQDHEFNSGIWNDLEKQVRYWVKKYGQLYIVAGGIFSKNSERIGRENVAVPDYFYKVVLDMKNKKSPQMIGFIIPHKASKETLETFIVSVDSIEKRTGIDFFSALPDSLEESLESGVHPEKWRFVHFERY